jgi:hypothetical protein
VETKDLEKEQEGQLKLKVGARYIHNKTSNEYIIISITEMKHPDTGDWIPAVIYKRDGLKSLWCRSVESFKSHFSDAKVEGDEVYL